MGERLVALGLVGAPHGLRGEVRVRLYNPASSLLETRPEIVLRGPAGRPERVVRIAEARRSGGAFMLVALEGVGDRDAAAELRGAELCIARAALPALDEGELYVIDLIGLRVERPDGAVVGQVLEVIDYPASQVLAVETPTGALEVPMLAPYFVEARIAQGVVIVDAIEDLELQPGRSR